MEVEILFFARLRELAGTSTATVRVPAEASVADALKVVAAAYPSLGDYLPRCRTAVNEEFAPPDTVIPERGVLAIIPPVSGG